VTGGVAYFLYMLQFNRQALDNEPGESDVFVEHSA
jgi:hypothetical protein